MNKLKKNILVGKINFILFLFYFFLITTSSAVISQESLNGQFIEIKILDKVSSKTNLLKLTIGEEKNFQNLLNKDNNEVFIFNGWTFSSSPAINPFDHPVYDIWLTKCY